MLGCKEFNNGKKAKYHGYSHTPDYYQWQRMIQRCHQPSCNDYKWYGAKGIEVCKSWRASFLNFIADMGRRPKGLTLDRIDGSKGYFKENCRWVDMRVQNRNSSHTTQIKFRGESKCVTEWAEIIGIKAGTLYQRIFKLKWSIEKSLTTPLLTR